MPIVNYSYTFQYGYHPTTGLRRPLVGVTLYGPRGEVDTLAEVDSGSRLTLFAREFAQQIGIEDLTSGIPEKYHPLAGGERIAYTHYVDLEIHGVRFPTKVAFASDNIGRNLLGRHGFFDHCQVGFREQMLEWYWEPIP